MQEKFLLNNARLGLNTMRFHGDPGQEKFSLDTYLELNKRNGLLWKLDLFIGEEM